MVQPDGFTYIALDMGQEGEGRDGRGRGGVEGERARIGVL